jgi:SAM-dependent methyltransferase
VSGDYAVLAPIYDAIGMADFAEVMTPRLLDFAQRNDWVGRRTLDLGCGTGVSARWLAQHGYRSTGMDNAAPMLQTARRTMDTSGLSLHWMEHDIRDISEDLGAIDLVFALDVLNELNALKDVEAVFQGVQKVLEPEKLFIFDLHTLGGLNEQGQTAQSLTYDSRTDLTVFSANAYDHERQTLSREHIIFRREANGWQRYEARQALRGFPLQVIATLIQRCGFAIMTVMDMYLQPVDLTAPNAAHVQRVIFVAQKQGGGT